MSLPMKMGKTNLFTDPHTTNTTNTGESAPTRKFMFERSFDASAAARAPERKPVTLKPEQYDALKQESYDQGFTAGHQKGLDEQTDRLMTLLGKVANKIDAIIESMNNIHHNNQMNVRRIAMAMTKKFIPEFASRHGLEEIEAMLTGVIGEMVHEPRLVVRVHESQFDVLNEKISAIADKKAYNGKIVVLADAEIAAGDCRVEWADGGMERNTEDMLKSFERTVTP